MLGNMKINTPARASGFTLVELCVVIIILGTVIALVSTGYQSWQAQKRVETNQERIASASEKIHEYRKIRGFYPQPASLTAPRSDATYGQALDKQASPTPPSAAGSCTNGICRQDGVGGRNVLIGTIPFRELNIPEEEAYDVYGARIVYAVTENATEDEFKENEGALRVLNEKGENLFPDGTGHFAVLSPGKNRKGGFSMEGTQIAACNGTTADTANCDFLTGQAQAVFNSNPYSEAANAGDYFDDFISFNKQPEERALWRRGLTENTENPNDLISMAENKIIVGAQKRINANDGRLSILYDPTNSDFDGSLYVRGALQTKRICDEDNSNCQDVSGLTRDCTGPGEYVIGFYNGRPQCGSIYFGCKEGQILTGISPSGDPTCTNAPLAPQDGQCGSAAGTTIPTAPSGDTALCRRGDATAVNEGTDNFTWRCTGLNNGQTANCSAAKTPPPYNGVCGADNGRTLASAPTARCSVGTESGFSGSGPWTWTCLGEGAGSQNANCSAQRTPPTSCECGPGNCGVVATNGVCNNSARNTCSAGSPANGGETSTHYTWHCNGLNGGANATNCQMAKPVTPAGSAAYCWGDGTLGTLGNGTQTVSANPVAVTMPAGVTSFIDISSSAQSDICAIGNNGRAYCWGSNGAFPGLLGIGSTTYPDIHSTPTAVTMPSGISSFSKIRVGSMAACALADTGNVYCWGSDRIYTGAGYNDARVGTSPIRNPAPSVPAIKPSGVTRYVDINVSFDSVCALGDNGRIYCWGNEQEITNPYDSWIIDTPRQVTMPTGVTAFTKLSETTDLGGGPVGECAFADNNNLYCWGEGKFGSVGNGVDVGANHGSIPGVHPRPQVTYYIPQQVLKPSGVSQYTEVSNDCALNNNGQPYCWGPFDPVSIYTYVPDSSYAPELTATLLPNGVSSLKKIYFNPSSSVQCMIGNNDRLYCFNSSDTTPRQINFPNTAGNVKKVTTTNGGGCALVQ